MKDRQMVESTIIIAIELAVAAAAIIIMYNLYGR